MKARLALVLLLILALSLIVLSGCGGSSKPSEPSKAQVRGESSKPSKARARDVRGAVLAWVHPVQSSQLCKFKLRCVRSYTKTAITKAGPAQAAVKGLADNLGNSNCRAKLDKLANTLNKADRASRSLLSALDSGAKNIGQEGKKASAAYDAVFSAAGSAGKACQG